MHRKAANGIKAIMNKNEIEMDFFKPRILEVPYLKLVGKLVSE